MNEITITDSINEILLPYTAKERDYILARAWDACCDGAYLAKYSLSSDPWASGHELTCELIELAAVIDTINAKQREV